MELLEAKVENTNILGKKESHTAPNYVTIF